MYVCMYVCIYIYIHTSDYFHTSFTMASGQRTMGLQLKTVCAFQSLQERMPAWSGKFRLFRSLGTGWKHLKTTKEMRVRKASPDAPFWCLRHLLSWHFFIAFPHFCDTGDPGLRFVGSRTFHGPFSERALEPWIVRCIRFATKIGGFLPEPTKNHSSSYQDHQRRGSSWKFYHDLYTYTDIINMVWITIKIIVNLRMLLCCCCMLLELEEPLWAQRLFHVGAEQTQLGT